MLPGCGLKLLHILGNINWACFKLYGNFGNKVDSTKYFANFIRPARFSPGMARGSNDTVDDKWDAQNREQMKEIESKALVPIPAPPAPDYCTPEMVQRMLISTLSAMGFQGNNSTKLWYVDSGASNHMTNNPTALCHVQPYAGQSSIQTANGNSLPIAAIGDASFKFTDVFLASQLSTNLISVGHLVDNNYLSMVWHRRLIHLNTQILSHVLNSDLPGNKDRSSLSLECDSCKLGKSKTLPFPLHASTASHCFDLIHSNVWGPSPTLRTNSSGVYLSNEFQAFLASKGIIHQRSCPSTPQQNGVAERKNRHLLDVGFVCYDPTLHHTRISKNVIFFENQHFFPVSSSTVSSSSTVVLPPLSSNSQIFIQSVIAFNQIQSIAAPSVCRSSRVSVPSNRYGFPSSSSGNSISSLTAALSNFDIPTCYSHAAKHDCWRQAMQEEIAALEANHTWDIELCPPTIVPLGRKWVYSIKVRSDGSLDHYKAQLVALGNNKEYGVNYKETFAPVAEMTNVRTILALAASSD
ncbi:Retrovirus-related Pol polyprotein from transposon RE2 [Vitis vinifera]|uniref:Retrovirus-related Pol polyprotein from transposon RE2 n=1 Tax=Vitis vinifera TaxID=29760 RepID=A0A438CX53_VITVI|nr:Retrovirus-related Pol polyprotein from transposon RE2 [Vitis vinifera]